MDKLFERVEKEQSGQVTGDNTHRSDDVTLPLSVRSRMKKSISSPGDLQQLDLDTPSPSSYLPPDTHIRGYGYSDEGQGQGQGIEFKAAAKRKKQRS